MLPTEAVPEIWEMSDWKAGLPEKKTLGAVHGGVAQALFGSNCFCKYGMGTIKCVPCWPT